MPAPDDQREARRRLYDGLREREIFPQVHYLPVHLLSESDQQRVVEAVRVLV